MDEQWKEALSGFETVWQRVSRMEAAEELPQNQQFELAENSKTKSVPMEHMMDAEANARQWYAAAAARTERRSGELLRHLAEDSGKSLKLLQTEYFLLQGDTWIPRKQPVPAAGTLDCLRRIYLEEQHLQGLYRYAVNTEVNETLRGLYEELERRCAGRMKTLRSLIQRVLG